MLEKSMGILFYPKKPKEYKTGPVEIYIRITVDGIPKELSAKVACPPGKWNSRAGWAVGTTEDTRAINGTLRGDPKLVEKVVYAFGLLEQLKQAGLDFIFKGGTSLLLLTDPPSRFSIDIDIIFSGTKHAAQSLWLIEYLQMINEQK